MKHQTFTLLFGLVCGLAGVGHADDVEITVVTGASLLSASTVSVLPPSFPGPASNGRFYPLQADDHSLSGGFLLGARIGYRLGKGSIVEAGLAVHLSRRRAMLSGVSVAG